MSEHEFDVVIVGAGVVGSILANELSREPHGKRVLVLEAGTGDLHSEDEEKAYQQYLAYMETFFAANIKDPNSAYPSNPNAPQPNVQEAAQIHGTQASANGYLVQQGPTPFRSSYTRSLGGTTLHWLGTCLRMLPDDFRLLSRFGVGRDWPISYADLQPYYRRAEWEIGVSGSVADQEELELAPFEHGRFVDHWLGIEFENGYVYPMERIPPSYFDRVLGDHIDGMRIKLGDEYHTVRVISTPQGRSGMPSPRGYKRVADSPYLDPKHHLYMPVGAVGNPSVGLRCAGNSNCTPICPIQAKYNAVKTLNKADRSRVTVTNRAVASRVELDENGRVAGIVYKRYESSDSPNFTTHVARGELYVLAAHAVENAKLMLASGLPSTSDQMGRNLMDHPTMLAWGLMPEAIGSYRGPGSTSGIPSFRNGGFRSEHAAFRTEVGNWGWNWPTVAPFSTVTDMVDQGNLFGIALRQKVGDVGQRQFRFGFLVEQLPEASNRVTINPDPQYLDRLGNYRPIISYDVSDYTRAGMAAARYVSERIFQRIGVEDHTVYDPADPGYVVFEGRGYVYNGAGHYAGTHVMGTTPRNSVVDEWQRSWDHENLYLAGCGSFPTLSTSNPTLTMAALTFRTAENILQALGG